MSKKRKNAQKKSTNRSSTHSDQNMTASDNGNDNSIRKKRFDSFPLHLVSNVGYAGKDNSGELRELCKGRVWVIPSFFSHKECRAWVDYCESFSSSNGENGFKYTAHPASKYVANRECHRLQQENATELSERIFERLRGMTVRTTDSGDENDNDDKGSILVQLQKETADLYPSIKSRNGKQAIEYKPINCNPNIRVYRYDEGHAFGRHVDGSNLVPGRRGGTTEMTMLIYLSTCQGGATRFHRSAMGGGRRSRQQMSSSSFGFEPQVGALLLHVHGKHCLEHEADVVLGGQKYVLRTDLVYGNE
jgi:hypothetical protein